MVKPAAETQPPQPMATLLNGIPASDYMVDAIRALGIEYVAANPGSSFRGLHESLLNHGGGRAPELLICLHEETSVGIAHGYARATGKPMLALMHAAVGLQHGAMSIYNAFVDRVPMLMIGATTSDAAKRRPYVEWVHAAQDGAALVRDFTKWDDQPLSPTHFNESLARAHHLSLTAPRAPVLLVADSELQEMAVSHAAEPPVLAPMPARAAVADPTGLATLARWLVEAENPLILADRYANSSEGLPLLVQLAELLGAPVIDLGNRFNFPTSHPLNQSSRLKNLIPRADLILAIEPVDLRGALTRFHDQVERTETLLVTPDARIVILGVEPVLRSNYQDFQRFVSATLHLEGDGEASLPYLIEAVRAARTPVLSERRAARLTTFTEASKRIRAAALEAAAFGWDISPISTARLCMELWDVLQGEDWSLASQTWSVSNWPFRLWDMEKPYHYLGVVGAGAIGSNISTALGVALANRGSGRITVNIQADGDLMYAPGALWTAAHHKIPMLTVMHNNRAYHQELMHIGRIAARLDRGMERITIGTTITDPNINFAQLARSMGVWSDGPIADPAKLGPALRRAIRVVKSGEPALIDVVCQGR
jgi:thiamine pyrophosphate-dependent acetolactate synthase large subunit-like protein